MRSFFIERDTSLTRVGSDWYKVADIDWNQHLYLSHMPGK